MGSWYQSESKLRQVGAQYAAYSEKSPYPAVASATSATGAFCLNASRNTERGAVTSSFASATPSSPRPLAAIAVAVVSTMKATPSEVRVRMLPAPSAKIGATATAFATSATATTRSPRLVRRSRETIATAT